METITKQIKHTPGPWGGLITAELPKEQKFVTITPKLAYVIYDGSDEAKANARLIASAPDILEALKEAKEELTFLYAQQQNEKFWSESAEIRLSKINSAIKKATE